MTITWEDKCNHSEHPSFLFPSLAFIDEHTWRGLGYLFTWGSLSWRCPLPESCACSVYTGGRREETEKALTLYKWCSAIAKFLVCYQHFAWSQMQTIGPYNFLWRKENLLHFKPHKCNIQRSRSGSIPFLSFITLGIQKDVHSLTEKLIGGIV